MGAAELHRLSKLALIAIGGLAGLAFLKTLWQLVGRRNS
jgi:hypothetical protein